MLETDMSPSHTESKNTESIMARDTFQNFKSTQEILGTKQSSRIAQDLLTLPEEMEHTEH